MQFHSKSIKQTFAHYKVDTKDGLSKSQVNNRKKIYGSNELIQKKKINPLVIFFRQFKSFIIYILIFAVVIALLAREFIDSIVILAILIFNAFFGFIQEYKAEKAIQALKKLSSPNAKVIRSGKIQQIDSKELVPGDIVMLEEGDKISADCRLIESINLEINESSLTGESMPVTKHTDTLKSKTPLAERKNMIFSGTSVTKGRGKAIIVSTGMNTEIGNIAELIGEVEKEETPLQKKLASLGKLIGFGVLLISFIVFLTGIIKDELQIYIFSGQYLQFILASKDWLLTAVALAVAAVPEGLPAIVTIALALGVRRMLIKKSLIRRLPSIETLGGANIICSDKTGTITKNEMTVTKAYVNLKDVKITGEGYELKGKATIDSKPLDPNSQFLFKIGALCNNSTLSKNKEKISIIGDPTESALLVSAEKAGINHITLQQTNKRINENPFDSVRKLMSTVYQDNKTKKSFIFTKGAPEKLLEKCDRILLNGKIIILREDVRKKILNKNDELASQALRVLGFAFKQYNNEKELESNLIFVGLQGMIDPARPEIRESISKCKTAGIRVIMVTGDNPNTAKAIANDIGLKGDAITGMDFSSLTQKEKLRLIKKVSIFARVEPAHKLEIIELLQLQNNVVAMTGDGVNDAPALKKADIGIAMGIKGTDVAKESSDMILQDDNFATIVNSVEEGRGIYENIKKFINYLLSCNVAEVAIIFLAILLSWPLPMTAIMLLWLNLVTDGLPALSLSVDPNSKDLMKKPPKRAKERIMNKSMTFNVLYVSTLITIAVLSLFYWAIINYAPLGPEIQLMKIQTIAFTAIIVMELARLQAIRSEYKLGIFSNRYLILAVAGSIFLQLIVIYTPLRTFFGTLPLNLVDWGMIIGATAAVFALNMVGIAIKNRMAWFKD